MTPKLEMKIDGSLVLTDNNGAHWHYKKDFSRIACVEADNEYYSSGQMLAYAQNGYGCDSFADGMKLLKEYGYIDEIPVLESEE